MSLAEHQFQLITSTDTLTFGIGCGLDLTDGGFTPGGLAWTTQDASNPRNGGYGFGRDVPDPQPWSWDSFVNADDEPTIDAILGAASKAWRNEVDSQTPGKLATLRYQFAGRTRRIFGRPRNFTTMPNNLTMQGYLPVSHDFQPFNDISYDDVQQQITVNNSAVAPAGISFPLTFPTQALPGPNSTPGQAVVGGTARTYPVVTFTGPWVNPSLITDDWTLTIKTSLTASQSVTADLRPWAMSVIRNDGAGLGGALAPQTWLEDMYFEPQTRVDMRVGGSTSSGTATCTVAWRDAYTGW